MKIIEQGSTLRIFGDDLRVRNEIPVGTYKVAFNPMSGYTLERRPTLDVVEKVYGNHERNAEQIVTRYMNMDKSFGTILGGKKGTGKSLTARLISKKCHELGIPTIIIDSDTDGIVDYLESIEQRVLVLFDEFEKVFPDRDDRQEKFLSLFDGMTNNKHLYLVTINEYHKLNHYFLGRTGRFYYNFEYKEITREEISEYLTDKLNDTSDVKHITEVAHRINMNYDQLSAIISELNYGETFENAITYLNLDLKNLESVNYRVTITLGTGEKLSRIIGINPLKPVVEFNVEENEHDFNIKVVLTYENGLYIPGEHVVTHDYNGKGAYEPGFIKHIELKPHVTLTATDIAKTL